MGILGSITRTLFGGSKQTSGNKFAGEINDTFSPWTQQGSQGYGQAANILGLNGADATSGALDDYWDSSGGKFLLDQGLDAIGTNNFARGIGNSGATMKAMENYRSGLASTKLNEYLGHLTNFNQQALGAGGLITQAGQTSKGTNSSGGLGKFLGQLFGGL